MEATFGDGAVWSQNVVLIVVAGTNTLDYALCEGCKPAHWAYIHKYWTTVASVWCFWCIPFGSGRTGVFDAWSMGGQKSEFLWNSVQALGWSFSLIQLCAQHKICRHPKPGIKWAVFNSCENKGCETKLGQCDVTTSSTALFYLLFQVQKLHAYKKRREG